jgi:hypothetical protein
VETKAFNLRREKHEAGAIAGWPRLDTEEAGEKAINEEFNEANGSYWDAEAARKAKQWEVTKLQKAMDNFPEARKADEGKGDKRPAEEAVCQARSGPREKERALNESRKQSTKKAKIPSDKRKALQSEWMEAVWKENDARHKAEGLYTTWAEAERARAWAKDPSATAGEQEEKHRLLSIAIAEAKELSQAVATARELHNLQEAAEEAADSASQGSYSSGEPELHGAREEAEREALAGYTPPGSQEDSQGAEEQ